MKCTYLNFSTVTNVLACVRPWGKDSWLEVILTIEMNGNTNRKLSPVIIDHNLWVKRSFNDPFVWFQNGWEHFVMCFMLLCTYYLPIIKNSEDGIHKIFPNTIIPIKTISFHMAFLCQCKVILKSNFFNWPWRTLKCCCASESHSFCVYSVNMQS